MSINKELIAELLKDYKSPEDLLGKEGILKQLQKAVIEKALEAEMTHHLGYEKHQRSDSVGLEVLLRVLDRVLIGKQGSKVKQPIDSIGERHVEAA